MRIASQNYDVSLTIMGSLNRSMLLDTRLYPSQ